MSADGHVGNVGRMLSMGGGNKQIEIGNIFLNAIGLSSKLESLLPSPLAGIALETAVGGLVAPLKNLKVTNVLEMKTGIFSKGGGK